MSKLQELIEQYCPDGVEYKALSEIGELVKGSGLQKKDFTEEGVGCIHYGQIHSYFGTYAEQVIARVPESLAKKLTVVHPGDLVVAVTSEDVAACCKAVAWVGKEDIFTGGHCVVIRHDMEPKFLSYCFQTTEFYKQKKRFAAGVKVTEMRTDRLVRIKVPVPPIEVQREIVRLLDAYTAAHDALVAKLNEEIAVHAKQFTSLCNTLICKDEYERKTIGELGELVRGKRFTAADYVDDGIGCIHYGEVYTDYGYSATETKSSVRNDIAGSLRYAHTGDVVIACTGENKEDICKPVAWLGDYDVAVHDDCHIVQHGEEPRYMSYAMLTDEFRIQKKKAATESKVVRVSGKNLGMMTLPITDIAEQAKIADTLDAFVAISKAKVEVIEEEIALLDMQAEAFRNQILSFPEKAA